MTSASESQLIAPWDCPECGVASPYVNVGRVHIGFCQHCGVSWYIGANLFSGWKEETEDEQRAAWAAAGLESLRRVDS